MSLPAVLLLALLRVEAAQTVHPRPDQEIPLLIHRWEAQFWGCWALVWGLVLGLAPRRGAAAARLLFHLSSSLVLVYSVLDLGYFEITGGRLGYAVVRYGLSHAADAGLAVGTVMEADHLLRLAAAALLGLWPLLVGRSAPNGRRLVARAARGGRWPIAVTPLLLASSALGTDAAALPSTLRPLAEPAPLYLAKSWWTGRQTERAPRMLEAYTPPTARPRESARPNVVLILLESTRATATTPYRPDLDTTPNLAALARDGLLVERAYAVVAHTSKALRSVLCGDSPVLLAEITESRPGGVPVRCLPDLLAEAGYRTAFFQSASEFEDRQVLVHNLGFHHFRAGMTMSGGQERLVAFGWDERVMIEPSLAWVAESDQPFFLTYLTVLSHEGYGYPPSHAPLEFPDVPEKQARYYNSVRYIDGFVGELVERYRQAGLLDETVFVIMGDHGEAFGEHGTRAHDNSVHEETMWIPWVFYGPTVLGGRAGTLPGTWHQPDLLPTVLDLVGVEVEGGPAEGRSMFSGDLSERVLYLSCWMENECLGAVSGTRKFIDALARDEAYLYDLSVDPGELRNIASNMEPSEVEAWRARLGSWRAGVNQRHVEAVRAWADARHGLDDHAPALASWDNGVALLGCAPRTPHNVPGGYVSVDCRWRLREERLDAPTMELRVVVGEAVARQQRQLLDGLVDGRPLRAGVVLDSFVVQVPSRASPGVARVEVRWPTRLGALLRWNKVRPWTPLAEFEVRAPEPFPGE